MYYSTALRPGGLIRRLEPRGLSVSQSLDHAGLFAPCNEPGKPGSLHWAKRTIFPRARDRAGRRVGRPLALPPPAIRPRAPLRADCPPRAARDRDQAHRPTCSSVGGGGARPRPELDFHSERCDGGSGHWESTCTAKPDPPCAVLISALMSQTARTLSFVLGILFFCFKS